MILTHEYKETYSTLLFYVLYDATEKAFANLQPISVFIFWINCIKCANIKIYQLTKKIEKWYNQFKFHEKTVLSIAGVVSGG